jgi:TonB family protein
VALTGDHNRLKIGVLTAIVVIGIAIVLIVARITQVELKPTGPVGLRGDPGEAFGPDAYPADAIRHGEQGRTVARLSVGSDGDVTLCAIKQSSGSQSLDKATCRIAIRQLHFKPARDGDGKAIPASFTLPVRWVLPDQ